MAVRKANGEGTVYRRKDGRWEAAGFADFPDGTRRRVRAYADTRAEALARLAWNIQAAGRGALAVAGGVTVGEYVTTWMATVAGHRLRASTLETYRTYVQRFVLPHLGSRPLAALSPKDIRRWLDRLASECQCCRQGFDAKRPAARQRCCALGACCRKVLASATVAYTHGILKSALADAVREEQLSRNVATLAPAPPIRSAPINPWTAAEAQAFLAHIRGRERFALAFELALRTGLRIGEVCALSWDDVDLDKNVLTVRRSLRRHLNGAGLTLTEPKTKAARRRIPLPPGCAELLRAHRARQDAVKATMGARWVESGLIVTTLVGTAVDPVHLSKYFQDAVRRAGVRKIRFHDLRHTCATLLLESGADLTVIKDLLGHSKIQITADVYTHVRLRVVRSAFDAMSHMLDDPCPESDDAQGPDGYPLAA
jgi:integrase